MLKPILSLSMDLRHYVLTPTDCSGRSRGVSKVSLFTQGTSSCQQRHQPAMSLCQYLHHQPTSWKCHHLTRTRTTRSICWLFHNQLPSMRLQPARRCLHLTRSPCKSLSWRPFDIFWQALLKYNGLQRMGIPHHSFSLEMDRSVWNNLILLY